MRLSSSHLVTMEKHLRASTMRVSRSPQQARICFRESCQPHAEAPLYLLLVFLIPAATPKASVAVLCSWVPVAYGCGVYIWAAASMIGCVICNRGLNMSPGTLAYAQLWLSISA